MGQCEDKNWMADDTFAKLMFEVVYVDTHAVRNGMNLKQEPMSSLSSLSPSSKSFVL